MSDISTCTADAGAALLDLPVRHEKHWQNEAGVGEADLEGVNDASLHQVLVSIVGSVVAIVSLCIALQQLSHNHCTLNT